MRGATHIEYVKAHTTTISIHAPRAGCDFFWASVSVCEVYNFNPRTPCGVRRRSSRLLAKWRKISIHAPRAGCDSCRICLSRVLSNFNPRTPCGVRPFGICAASRGRRNFNPRTPCGVRPEAINNSSGAAQFQSTHPVRGATMKMSDTLLTKLISIHAPRAGCDGKFDDFNPLNLHKRYKRVLDRPKSTSEQGKNKAKLAYIHVFTVLGGAKVPELSARFYFAPNTIRLSARPWRHSPLWHRNARCGCDTYPQGSKSADCLRIHP